MNAGGGGGRAKRGVLFHIWKQWWVGEGGQKKNSTTKGESPSCSNRKEREVLGRGRCVALSSLAHMGRSRHQPGGQAGRVGSRSSVDYALSLRGVWAGLCAFLVLFCFCPRSIFNKGILLHVAGLFTLQKEQVMHIVPRAAESGISKVVL